MPNAISTPCDASTPTGPGRIGATSAERALPRPAAALITLLDPRDAEGFPDAELAEVDPDGLLAVGGDLRPKRLLAAYRRGIFPWYSDEQPILWWSPDPRTLLYPERLHLSRSLKKRLRRCAYQIRFDTAFTQVIDACAAPRQDEAGTWITAQMRQAYIRLHQRGHVHCSEVWEDETLVGGLYGVRIGRAFFGESMFSRVADGSKIALAALVYRFGGELDLIDCQVRTEHMISLGAEEIPRSRFTALLAKSCAIPAETPFWRDIQFPAAEITPISSTPRPAASP